MLTEEKLDVIGARLETSPRKLLVQLAQQMGMCVSGRFARKPLHLHPNKATVVHKLCRPIMKYAEFFL
jgi:hypothetical protein